MFNNNLYMDNSDSDIFQKQKVFDEQEKNEINEINQDLNSQKDENKDPIKEVIHLNSLITKNISLFTKNPNYKLLAWLIVQIIIFSLFILTISFLKNNFLPYFNSI